MSDLTLLTKDQCFGSHKLEILKKRGTKAAMTDFSLLSGGNEGDYWTKSYGGKLTISLWGDEYSGDVVYYIDDTFNGGLDQAPPNIRCCGGRPVLPFSSISSIPTNGENVKRAKDEIFEVEYGYYPQEAASKKMQAKLEEEYINGKLKKTGNSYTRDSRKYDDYDKKFLEEKYYEFLYKGEKYVRVYANFEMRISEIQMKRNFQMAKVILMENQCG